MPFEEGCWSCLRPGSLRAAHRSVHTRSKSRTGPVRRRFALANGIVEPRYGRAEVAELADASVSKTDVRKDVRVRLPLSAPQCDVAHLWPSVWPILPFQLDNALVLWILLRL